MKLGASSYLFIFKLAGHIQIRNIFIVVDKILLAIPAESQIMGIDCWSKTAPSYDFIKALLCLNYQVEMFNRLIYIFDSMENREK